MDCASSNLRRGRLDTDDDVLRIIQSLICGTGREPDRAVLVPCRSSVDSEKIGNDAAVGWHCR
jgi:hypothetical protein